MRAELPARLSPRVRSAMVAAALQLSLLPLPGQGPWRRCVRGSLRRRQRRLRPGSIVPQVRSHFHVQIKHVFTNVHRSAQGCSALFTPDAAGALHPKRAHSPSSSSGKSGRSQPRPPAVAGRGGRCGRSSRIAVAVAGRCAGMRNCGLGGRVAPVLGFGVRV